MGSRTDLDDMERRRFLPLPGLKLRLRVVNHLRIILLSILWGIYVDGSSNPSARIVCVDASSRVLGTSTGTCYSTEMWLIYMSV
jgi:hypothetical protein